jgi:phenylacetate-CoA ligase
LPQILACCSSFLLRQRLKRPRLEAWQTERLRALVAHAYQNVPYYRRLFDSAGLRPRHIQTLRDLASIPITTRTDLQSAPAEEVIARGYRLERLVVHRTSGSTGEPFSIRRTAFEDRLLQAHRLAVLFRLGLRIGDRRAAVVSDRLAGTPLYARAGILRYDEIHCLAEPAEILARLRAIRPDMLRGYSGTLAFLAGMMTGEERKTIRPRFVTTDSETLTDEMRERIEAGFGARVFDFYDSHEFNMIASECPSSGLFHVSETSLIAEVLAEGRAAEPHQQGQLVGTALHSWAMPFIRFALGDLVTRGPDRCPCGAPSSILTAVNGRIADRFELPGGRSVHPYTLVNPLMEHGPWVRQYQIVQDRLDRVKVKLAPMHGENPPAEGVAAVQQVLRERLGPGIGLEVELVSQIPAAPSGKQRPYLSLVAKAAGLSGD